MLDVSQIQIQMSTGERVKILDYLPPEEKQKVITLVQRLKEESEAKDKYMVMYQQSQQALQDLTLKYNQLKDQNQHLKQQIHNSFSIVSQVRAQFHANKQKSHHQPDRDEQEWEDEEPEDNEENFQNSANQITVISHPPRHNHKSPLEKYRPPMTTNKKSPNILNLSITELNNTNLTGSRGKQIDDLRKQVRTLQQEKRKKDDKDRHMKQKMRLVDEIKNRYKNGEENSQYSESKPRQGSSLERIDITDTFEEQEAKTLYSHQKSRNHTQVRSTQKPPSTHGTKALENIDRSETNRLLSVPNQAKLRCNKEVKPAAQKINGHVITAEDYSDVLDMINGFNL